MSSLEFAIIGATGSGKSALAIDLAKELDGVVLSLDSLSIYKEIDIASAKPTKEEQEGVVHFGLDILYPDEPFDVTKFIEIYKEASNLAKEQKKSLIITGGSSFYLKMLIEGVSPFPEITKETQEMVKEALKNREDAYKTLQNIDPKIDIKPNDTYRLKRALEIFFATKIAPSRYFELNPPEPVIKQLPIFEITLDRDILRKRVELRTKKMFEMGLVDEVANLEFKYRNRSLTPLKAIGIREILSYFDGIYSRKRVEEKIVTNTLNLAKRQVTFNRSQFKNIVRGDSSSLKKVIIKKVAWS